MIDLQAELQGHYEIQSGLGPFSIQFSPHQKATYFQGHFPGYPILPAVGIVDISRYFIETYIEKKKRTLKAVRSFKVKTPVGPDQVLTLIFEKLAAHQFEVVWRNKTEDSISAELTLEFQT